MTRESMIAFTRERIKAYEQNIKATLGSEAGYTGKDMLADYTGIIVEKVEALSDNELQQIVDSYI